VVGQATLHQCGGFGRWGRRAEQHRHRESFGEHQSQISGVVARGVLLLVRRIVLFVDRPVDAGREVERWLGRSAAGGPVAKPTRRGRGRALPGGGIAPRGRPFNDLLDALPALNLDAPSDYGRVFHQLSRETSRWCGRNTLLVILGDGRNNRLDPLDWALDEVAERCAATLWLVPEPLREWGSGDSALADYLPHVDLAVEARNLDGLALGVAELMRRF